jgi:hypothetical protein
MLLGEVFHTTGNHAHDRSVAIAHQYFFTVPNHLDVSTKPSFQVTDVNGFHIAIIRDVTMLVILTPCLLPRIGIGTDRCRIYCGQPHASYLIIIVGIRNSMITSR